MLKANYKSIKKAGMKVTKQRALVLDIIRSGHLDADEIYRLARPKNPRLSLSTVYRALQKFKQFGLIEELHFDESHHHYEVKPSAEHHHLLCLGCGRVIEFKYPLSRHIERNVVEASGFNITGTKVSLTGYCAECQQKRKKV